MGTQIIVYPYRFNEPVEIRCLTYAKSQFFGSLEQLAKRLMTPVELTGVEFPFLLIGGDCTISLAPYAAMARRHFKFNVIWIDAHADSNTDETSPSGCIGGMPVAILDGRQRMERWFDQYIRSAESVYHYRLPADNIDPKEYVSGIIVKEFDLVDDRYPIYLHIDVDYFKEFKLKDHYCGGVETLEEFDWEGLKKLPIVCASITGTMDPEMDDLTDHVREVLS